MITTNKDQNCVYRTNAYVVHLGVTRIHTSGVLRLHARQEKLVASTRDF
jgi:hypothetical protein